MIKITYGYFQKILFMLYIEFWCAGYWYKISIIIFGVLNSIWLLLNLKLFRSSPEIKHLWQEWLLLTEYVNVCVVFSERSPNKVDICRKYYISPLFVCKSKPDLCMTRVNALWRQMHTETKLFLPAKNFSIFFLNLFLLLTLEDSRKGL